MESDDQYGPALPPGMVVASERASSSAEGKSSKKSSKNVIGPSLAPGMQKSSDSDDLSDEGALTVKMDPEMSPEYTIQDDQEEADDKNNSETVGPMPSEMTQEVGVTQVSEEFERRSKRMKDQLTVKAEAEEGPSKREEWMTELPPDMSKNFGLQNRTFSKGAGAPEDKDRSSWTDTPTVKKEKDGSSKGKKRKREEEKAASGRDQQLQQQVDEYNKSKRPDSLMDMHAKKQKKKKGSAAAPVTSTPADSTQPAPAATATTSTVTPVTQPPNGQVPGQPQPQQAPGQPQPPQATAQQQQHMQQYFQLSDEIRESLDLLTEQKNQEQFYSQEFAAGEFNEAKPLADLLMNSNMVTYNQDGTATFSQAGQAQTPFSSSQMIAQAYSHAQQLSVSTPAFSQVVSTNSFPAQSLPAQVAGNMNVTVVNSSQAQDAATAAAVAAAQQQQQQQQQQQTHQATAQTIEVNGQQIQTQQATAQPQIQAAQQVHGYSEAYAAQVTGDAAVAQQQQQQHQQGQVVTFSLAGGQNMIIASPHTQQAGQNYVIAQQGAAPGQNIVIAAPGQQAMSGNFIVKTEGEELGQNIVLTQNLQQALGQNVLLTQDGQIATAAPTENMVLATADGQRAQTITATRQIQPAPQPQPQQQQVLTQAGIPLQAGGAQIPQVSLVLPPVNSLFPQIQSAGAPQAATAAATTATVSPQAFLQLCAKMDKMMGLVKDSQTVLFEMNKRVERIETHLFPQPTAMTQATPNKSNKNKPRPVVPASSTPQPAGGASTNTQVTKASLKAALSNYLTISDYTATDELKRSDSNSDLFIPVGTVSMVQGQAMIEAPSPSETPETASSTVAELPTEQDLLPVVLNNMGQPVANASVPTSDINVPIVDSQSGIAVTVYDEGNENQKFELGPGSSKEPNARFSNTSGSPKTVILDPRFWDILVEDFQKNMSSDQIISAMSSTRKPLVRSIGTSEISICSTVLKEAESACQGRRERLAKELVFRIFTLGEVYDRNVSGVFYINGKKMENKNKALDPAKMAAIHYLVMKYPPSVVDNPRLERLVWKNCVDRINDALRRIYNWIHKIVDVNNIMDKLPTDSIMMH
ncbi:polyhomeotic-proximal chromatin protein isoform X2 [Aplysia californica]|uniref:Polyhomeotic-proximal chromatin protein isoform X2 n=1 Tax=Aplysia californica TaxID=6500 RepID=A0ABM0K2D9_APLCA|nr:polyhomeotic-proximal chromatin protein isoform X2 [Aplysia californica]